MRLRLAFTQEATEALKSMAGMNAEHRNRIRELRKHSRTVSGPNTIMHKLAPIAELEEHQCRVLAAETFEKTERM